MTSATIPLTTSSQCGWDGVTVATGASSMSLLRVDTHSSITWLFDSTTSTTTGEDNVFSQVVVPPQTLVQGAWRTTQLDWTTTTDDDWSTKIHSVGHVQSFETTTALDAWWARECQADNNEMTMTGTLGLGLQDNQEIGPALHSWRVQRDVVALEFSAGVGMMALSSMYNQHHDDPCWHWYPAAGPGWRVHLADVAYGSHNLGTHATSTLSWHHGQPYHRAPRAAVRNFLQAHDGAAASLQCAQVITGGDKHTLQMVDCHDDDTDWQVLLGDCPATPVTIGLTFKDENDETTTYSVPIPIRRLADTQPPSNKPCWWGLVPHDNNDAATIEWTVGHDFLFTAVDKVALDLEWNRWGLYQCSDDDNVNNDPKSIDDNDKGDENAATCDDAMPTLLRTTTDAIGLYHAQPIVVESATTDTVSFRIALEDAWGSKEEPMVGVLYEPAGSSVSVCDEIVSEATRNTRYTARCGVEGTTVVTLYASDKAWQMAPPLPAIDRDALPTICTHARERMAAGDPVVMFQFQMSCRCNGNAETPSGSSSSKDETSTTTNNVVGKTSSECPPPTLQKTTTDAIGLYKTQPIVVESSTTDSVSFRIALDEAWGPNEKPMVGVVYTDTASGQSVCREIVSDTTRDDLYTAHCDSGSHTALVTLYASDQAWHMAPLLSPTDQNDIPISCANAHDRVAAGDPIVVFQFRVPCHCDDSPTPSSDGSAGSDGATHHNSIGTSSSAAAASECPEALLKKTTTDAIGLYKAQPIVVDSTTADTVSFRISATAWAPEQPMLGILYDTSAGQSVCDEITSEATSHQSYTTRCRSSGTSLVTVYASDGAWHMAPPLSSTDQDGIPSFCSNVRDRMVAGEPVVMFQFEIPCGCEQSSTCVPQARLDQTSTSVNSQGYYKANPIQILEQHGTTVSFRVDQSWFINDRLGSLAIFYPTSALGQRKCVEKANVAAIATESWQANCGNDGLAQVKLFVLDPRWTSAPATSVHVPSMCESTVNKVASGQKLVYFSFTVPCVADDPTFCSDGDTLDAPHSFLSPPPQDAESKQSGTQSDPCEQARLEKASTNSIVVHENPVHIQQQLGSKVTFKLKQTWIPDGRLDLVAVMYHDTSDPDQSVCQEYTDLQGTVEGIFHAHCGADRTSAVSVFVLDQQWNNLLVPLSDENLVPKLCAGTFSREAAGSKVALYEYTLSCEPPTIECAEDTELCTQHARLDHVSSHRYPYQSNPIALGAQHDTAVSFTVEPMWKEDIASLSVLFEGTNGEPECAQVSFWNAPTRELSAQCLGGSTSVILYLMSADFADDDIATVPPICSLASEGNQGLVTYHFTLPCQSTDTSFCVQNVVGRTSSDGLSPLVVIPAFLFIIIVASGTVVYLQNKRRQERFAAIAHLRETAAPYHDHVSSRRYGQEELGGETLNLSGDRFRIGIDKDVHVLEFRNETRMIT